VRKGWNNKKEISCTMCWSLSCGFSLRKRDPSLVMRHAEPQRTQKNAPQAPWPSEKKDTPSEGIHPPAFCHEPCAARDDPERIVGMWGLMPGQAASLCACDPPSKSWNVLLLRILSNSTSMGEVQQYAIYSGALRGMAYGCTWLAERYEALAFSPVAHLCTSRAGVWAPAVGTMPSTFRASRPRPGQA